MMEIINFLKEHYQLIIEIASFIITVLILVLKKRPVFNTMDEIKEDVLEVLPSLISSVESPGNGQEKLSTVLSLVKSYIAKKYQFTEFEKIETFVVNAIESILSTPSKKG